MFKNILDYVEGPKGVIGSRLYPVQRFLLKLNHGIELDKRLPRVAARQIQVTDHFREKVLWKFSEVDYLHYLYDEGRCNIREQEHRPNLILAGGRRMGMTWVLAELSASWEVLRLLNQKNPQAYFGAQMAQPLSVMTVTHNKKMATAVMEEFLNNVDRCSELSTHKLSERLDRVFFQTPLSRELYGKDRKRAGIHFITLSATCKTIHGIGRTLLIFDGVAYFPNSADTVHAQLPTVMKGGRYLMMSTPNKAKGTFYESFTHAMKSGNPKDPLAIMIPTWEGNPTISSSFLKKEYSRDPIRFRTDYGARFAAVNSLL